MENKTKVRSYNLHRKKDIERLKEDCPEIGEYAERFYNSTSGKIHRFVHKSLFGLIGITALALGVSFGAHATNSLRAKHYLEMDSMYSSIEDFSEVLAEEKEKIGIEGDIDFSVHGDEKKSKGVCRAVNDGYEIEMHEDYLSRFILRHELYHCKHHVRQEGFSRYINLAREKWEWDATSYAKKMFEGGGEDGREVEE